ncbi:TetR/AcrR family transcriptional regulator [Pseudomonas sp. B392_1p]|uniref:TetR/AcrR family transcriptional regulator n=1 Tax=Pseudomonas sp. B392_1p TaxID=3457507 RepID=UPI003FD49029
MKTIVPTKPGHTRPGPVNAAEAESRHRRILGAARKLFVTHGLNGTSLDAIARESQITKRTIYLLFQSKEGLFVATLTDCVDAIADAVRRTPDAPDLASTLVGIARAYAQALDNPQTLAMYRIAIGESERIPPEARHALNIYGEHSAQGVVTALLEKAQERGVVKFRSLDIFSRLFLDLILAPHFTQWLLGAAPPPEKPDAVSRFLKAADDLYETSFSIPK